MQVKRSVVYTIEKLNISKHSRRIKSLIKALQHALFCHVCNRSLCVIFVLISLLFYFFSSLRRGDQHGLPVFAYFNWSRSPLKDPAPFCIGLSLWSCRYKRIYHFFAFRFIYLFIYLFILQYQTLLLLNIIVINYKS